MNINININMNTLLTRDIDGYSFSYSYSYSKFDLICNKCVGVLYSTHVLKKIFFIKTSYTFVICY